MMFANEPSGFLRDQMSEWQYRSYRKCVLKAQTLIALAEEAGDLTSSAQFLRATANGLSEAAAILESLER